MVNPLDLIILAQCAKCVWVEPWQKKHPAAFFLSWQFKMVAEWVGDGKIKTIIEDAKA